MTFVVKLNADGAYVFTIRVDYGTCVELPPIRTTSDSSQLREILERNGCSEVEG